jgi:hypothetical protein
LRPGQQVSSLAAATKNCEGEMMSDERTYLQRDRKEIMRLQRELAEAANYIQPLVDALNQIAAWNEGAEVTGKFDEPAAASKARAALAQFAGKGKG